MNLDIENIIFESKSKNTYENINNSKNLANPKENEKVADPACGSGGFLIFAMDHVYKMIEKNWDKIDEITDHKKDYAQQMIFGLDYDDRLVKVCKAYSISTTY